jgi:large subunit ribosomal protein L6
MIRVEGPRGRLEWAHHPLVTVRHEPGARTIVVERGQDSRFGRALHGLTRTLINNMVQGVVHGFEKRLTIGGIGYSASWDGKALVLSGGSSDRIRKTPPEGITVEVVQNTIVVRGIDKQRVGQFAAEVRKLRYPVPYWDRNKGPQGIYYEGEKVPWKPGKKPMGGRS